MSSFYKTSLGQVVLSRTFGPEPGRVNYKVSYARDGSHADMVQLGAVSRVPHRIGAWEIVDDLADQPRKRIFSTRRDAIEALQKAAT